MLYIRGSSNGRTEAFEAFNLGSIPSPLANIKSSRKASFLYLLGEASKLLYSRLGIERLFLAAGGKVPAPVGRDTPSPLFFNI